jgi:Na+/proline symporter
VSINLDHAIVYAFLGLTLLVGIISGRGVNSVSQYAIADRKFPALLVTLTMLATALGGGDMMGSVEEIFRSGLIYFVYRFGMLLGAFMVAAYLITRFAKKEFIGMISIADIIRYYYGKHAEAFTGFIGLLYSIGSLGLQLTALSYVVASMLDISHLYAVLLSSGIMVIYSSIGGVKSVAITDVLQLAMLIVVVPLVTWILADSAGGVVKVTQEMLARPYEYDESHLSYFLSSIMLLLPFIWMYPAMVQRLLMSRDAKHMQRVFVSYPLLLMVFMPLIAVIATVGYLHYPDAQPNEVFMKIVKHDIPGTVRGLAMAGVIGIIMSTADSFLNSGSVLFIHNFVKNLKPDLKRELMWMKVLTLIIGSGGALIAYMQFSLFEILSLVSGIWGAFVGIPLVAALLGLKPKQGAYWLCIVFSAIAVTYFLFFMPIVRNFPQFAGLFAGLLGFGLGYKFFAK